MTTVNDTSAKNENDNGGLVVAACLAVFGWIEIFLLHLTGIQQIQFSIHSILILPTALFILALVSSAPSKRIVSNRLIVGFWASVSAMLVRDMLGLCLYSIGLASFSVIKEITLTKLSSAAMPIVLAGYTSHFMFFATTGMLYALFAGKSKWFYGVGWILLLQASQWANYLTFTIFAYLLQGILLGFLVQRFCEQ